MKVSTKFNVDTTIRCLVRPIELLLLIRYMTSWPWHLTFWPWSLVIHGGSRGKSFDQVWGLRLSVLKLWVLTSPIGYHWQCVCSHCACAVSRDLCVGGKFFAAYLKSLTPICLFNIQFYSATIKTNGVIRQNGAWSCVKDHTALCIIVVKFE